MRRQFIAGNWKMNLNRGSAAALAEAVAKATAAQDGIDLAVCPPCCYLEAVGRAIAGSKVALGAQNIYHEKDGAFTGEISASMLCDLGCKYVILGHSERRLILFASAGACLLHVLLEWAPVRQPKDSVGELLSE